MHLLAPASQTALRAVGRLIRRGNRQDVAEMHLYDEKENLVAHATGTFIVLPNVPLRESD
ncbi:MAG TPA: PaaI family thioesterase [Candidatus Acidoferrales bacterium]|nr:PaaI family thioesterase [Candidatus Acidoferrales bacterium]